jgi:hypothetical protein
MHDLEQRPWMGEGYIRRDSDPHRGDLLLLWGNIALFCGIVSPCTVIPSLIALPVGLAIMITARRD